MELSKKVLILVLVGGLLVIGVWVAQSDIFHNEPPSRAKKVFVPQQRSRGFDG